MSKFNWWMRACGIFLLWATMAVALPAQTTTVAPTVTFTTLHTFDRNDGKSPNGLVQATDGNLYGTTDGGGHYGAYAGTVFKITPSGKLTTLYIFCSQGGSRCTDGVSPEAGLVQGTDGNFYGTTSGGGANGLWGTVFSITPSGTLTTLHSFDGRDGAYPDARLFRGTDGNFYGTTADGGAGAACNPDFFCGTVFKITPSGTLTTLYNFCSQINCTDGEYPLAGLVQATDGNFYGATYFGGSLNSSAGTIFKITPGGTLTTLYDFCSQDNCIDGDHPFAGLVQHTNGNFYGTTVYGGTHNKGSVFKITISGKLTTLHSFDGRDGAAPVARLVQAPDGNFYGTTEDGGTYGYGYGTVFEITPDGTLTTLHSFDGTDGENPHAGLVQDTNGNFFGTTSGGGANGDGTVFSLSVGLGPFVKTMPTSGKVGKAVRILGTNLIGATSVTFNGTAATFTVKSKSEITTTVPTGATTGTVQVVTPSGTLSSNVPFRVR
jgi:uncharacterized repeat protein (TIGR03803 family)